MKGIVWSQDFEKGCQQLDKIKEAYLAKNINIQYERRTTTTYFIFFENTDHWEVNIPYEATLERTRCNVSYIDKDMDPDILEKIILPATTDLPYNAIRYFNW